MDRDRSVDIRRDRQVLRGIYIYITKGKTGLYQNRFAGIVTSYGLDSREMDFPLLHSVQTGSGTNAASY
jgi:hypothetical protein